MATLREYGLGVLYQQYSVFLREPLKVLPAYAVGSRKAALLPPQDSQLARPSLAETRAARGKRPSQESEGRLAYPLRYLQVLVQ